MLAHCRSWAEADKILAMSGRILDRKGGSGATIYFMEILKSRLRIHPVWYFVVRTRRTTDAR